MKVAVSPAKEALKRCQVFSTVDDPTLEKIAATAMENTYEGGSVIFREGDPATELLIVQEGKVALQMALSEVLPASRRVTIDTVMPDEPVGWSAVVEPHRYTLTAVCLQRTRLLSISANKLKWLLEEDKAVGYQVTQQLIKVVASRLDETRRVLLAERSLS